MLVYLRGNRKIPGSNLGPSSCQPGRVPFLDEELIAGPFRVVISGQGTSLPKGQRFWLKMILRKAHLSVKAHLPSVLSQKMSLTVWLLIILLGISLSINDWVRLCPSEVIFTLVDQTHGSSSMKPGNWCGIPRQDQIPVQSLRTDTQSSWGFNRLEWAHVMSKFTYFSLESYRSSSKTLFSATLELKMED